jgi:hypothetical protein
MRIADRLRFPFALRGRDRRRRAFSAAVAPLIACACTGSSQGAVHDPAPVAAPGLARDCASADPPGLVLFIAGASPFDANLYVADPCRWTGRPAKAVPDGKISAVSAARGTVAVTAAPTTVDQVFELTGGRLRPILPGGMAGRSATAGPRGAVAFVTVGNDPKRPFAVETMGRTAPRAAYRSGNPLNPVVFGPDSTALVVGESPTKPGTLDPTGETFLTVLPAARRLPLRLRRISGLAYVPALNAVAVSGDTSEPGAVVPLERDERWPLPSGWRVNAADDGRLLLDRNGTLAVLWLDPGGRPHAFPPTAAGPVYGATWLSRDDAAALLKRPSADFSVPPAR